MSNPACRRWHGVIVGEPASKANSRQLVRIGGKWRLIKSKKARDYVASVQKQVTALDEADQLRAPIAMTANIYYASERPDLDPSLILDALQGRIYANDRAVREMHLYHHIDREHPRAVVTLHELPPDE